MSTTEKEKRISENLFQEIESVKANLAQFSSIPHHKWSHSFVQHPSNFPIVNYERVFFWRLETVGISKALFQLIFQQEPGQGSLNFDIKHAQGYISVQY